MKQQLFMTYNIFKVFSSTLSKLKERQKDRQTTIIYDGLTNTSFDNYIMRTEDDLNLLHEHKPCKFKETFKS